MSWLCPECFAQLKIQLVRIFKGNQKTCDMLNRSQSQLIIMYSALQKLPHVVFSHFNIRDQHNFLCRSRKGKFFFLFVPKRSAFTYWPASVCRRTKKKRNFPNHDASTTALIFSRGTRSAQQSVNSTLVNLPESLNLFFVIFFYWKT